MQFIDTKSRARRGRGRDRHQEKRKRGTWVPTSARESPIDGASALESENISPTGRLVQNSGRLEGEIEIGPWNLNIGAQVSTLEIEYGLDELCPT